MAKKKEETKQEPRKELFALVGYSDGFIEVKMFEENLNPEHVVDEIVRAANELGKEQLKRTVLEAALNQTNNFIKDVMSKLAENKKEVKPEEPKEETPEV